MAEDCFLDFFSLTVQNIIIFSINFALAWFEISHTNAGNMIRLNWTWRLVSDTVDRYYLFWMNWIQINL